MLRLWESHLLAVEMTISSIYNAGSGAVRTLWGCPSPPPGGGSQPLVSTAHYICVHWLARDMVQTNSIHYICMQAEHKCVYTCVCV